MESGKIIVVANQKGGVAKTSTVRNLSYALAEMGKKVLVVDFDPQYNLTTSFGVLPTQTPCNTGTLITNLLLDESLPDTNEFIQKIGSVDLIPSSRSLTVAEANLLMTPDSNDYLAALLNPLRLSYDYIIVDTNPSLGSLTINALTAADEVIIPIDPELFALTGLQALVDTIKKIKRKLNPSIEIGGILFTKCNKRTNLYRRTYGQVTKAFQSLPIRPLKKSSRRPESGRWHLPIRKTRMRCVLSWMTRKCGKPSMPYKEVPVSILIYKQRHRHPNYKKTPKGNYAHIGYIATRPGAVKNEGMRHGLFGKLEPGAVKEFDTWQEAARLVRELSYRRVNMYRGIISFSPETAAELGLSDHKAWEDYIDRHILTLAKFNGIRVQDLQWVAAHHNEKGHPHIHVVFWNKNQRTMVPFVHPSIPDKIRKQLIRDTFAERIKEYCEAKQRAKEHLSAITDEMIDEFEQYMEHLHPQEYRRLREAFGRITDDELGTSPLDSVVGAMKIAPFISRLFALKEKMPKKGRLYYKLLPEDVKAELDAFVAFLKENNEYIRNLVQDYAESKTRLAMLYDTDPAHIKEQQEKAVAEADKLIANKILDVIRTMLCKDREVQSFEYTEARKAYFTEQMICEILITLEQTAMSLDMEYDDRQKAMSTDLSKAARKEWYLRHKDKGMEP